LLAPAQANLGFDVFGSRLVNATDILMLDGAGDAYHMSDLVWRMEHGSSVPTSVENEREEFSPCAAVALYRRTALRKIGGFDEDFFW
jgi:GT2 family glycosyltransferase